MVTEWTAGWNHSGFLPDMEPQVFTDWCEAAIFVKNALESMKEQQEDYGQTTMVSRLNNLLHELALAHAGDPFEAIEQSLVVWIYTTKSEVDELEATQ